MRKLFLTLAIVLLTVITYAQSRYNVNKIILNHKATNDNTVYEPQDMQITIVNDYVAVSDKASSIYRRTGDTKEDENDDIRMITWGGLDEKGKVVMCSFVIYKKDGEFYFVVDYNDAMIMYQIVKIEQ